MKERKLSFKYFKKSKENNYLWNISQIGEPLLTDWLTHITFVAKTVSPQKCKQCAFNMKFLNINQFHPTNTAGLLVTNLMLLIPSRRYWQCNFMLNDARVVSIDKYWQVLASIDKYWQVLAIIGKYWQVLASIGNAISYCAMSNDPLSRADNDHCGGRSDQRGKCQDPLVQWTRGALTLSTCRHQNIYIFYSSQFHCIPLSTPGYLHFLVFYMSQLNHFAPTRTRISMF